MDEPNLTHKDRLAGTKGASQNGETTPLPPGRIRWKRLVACIAAAFVLAGLALSFWPHEPSILARPVHVLDVRSWALNGESQLGYYWLSDHELLFFRGSQQKGWHLFRYDLETRVETPLTQVSRLLNRSPAYSPQHMQVSPDGKWLLWPDIPATVIVAKLDGSVWFRQRATGNILWLGDGRHWMDIRFKNWYPYHTFVNTKAVIHSIDQPAFQREVSLNLNKYLGSQFFIDLSTLASTKQNRLRVVGGEDHKSYVILEQSLDLPDTPPRRIKSNYSGLFSPSGDRIALVGGETQRYALDDLLQRVWPSYHHPARPVMVSVSVSRLDDSRPRRLGSFQATSPARTESWAYLPRWLPDGKHLSLVNGSALYVIAVD
jgi:hypothetical protein